MCEANASVKSTSIKYEYTYETLPGYQQQTASDDDGGGGGDGIDVAILSSNIVRIFFSKQTSKKKTPTVTCRRDRPKTR